MCSICLPSPNLWEWTEKGDCLLDYCHRAHAWTLVTRALLPAVGFILCAKTLKCVIFPLHPCSHLCALHALGLILGVHVAWRRIAWPQFTIVDHLFAQWFIKGWWNPSRVHLFTHASFESTGPWCGSTFNLCRVVYQIPWLSVLN